MDKSFSRRIARARARVSHIASTLGTTKQLRAGARARTTSALFFGYRQALDLSMRQRSWTAAGHCGSVYHMTTTKHTKRIAGYIRVSTSDQADSHLGMDDQIDKVKAWCALHDAHLVECIEDAGLSAKNMDRPGLQRIIALAKAKRIDAVVVKKLDRLTRRLSHMVQLVEILTQHGVALISVVDGVDTSTNAGRLVIGMLGVVAQWEREEISERTSDASRQMQLQGRAVGSIAPTGFTFTADRKQVIDPAGQRVVAMITAGMAQGLSIGDITKQVNAARLMTTKGKHYGRSTIHRLMQSIRSGHHQAMTAAAA